jgi:hypothetical protein
MVQRAPKGTRCFGVHRFHLPNLRGPNTWPALAAASAAETVSSIAPDFMGFSGDTGGDRTLQAPEGVTPSTVGVAYSPAP